MDTVLSLDLGTSSTRAALYRLDDGSAVEDASYSVAHRPDVDHDGASTLDPESLLSEILTCAETALARAPRGTKIHGVGASSLWHSFVAIDSRYQPLTPAILWSDRRSADEVKELVVQLPDAPTRTGCPWHTSYVPPRLLWLAKNHPEIFAQTAHFVAPIEYVFLRLFGPGALRTSVSMASASGLLDQTTNTYDHEILRAVGVDETRLPALSDEPLSGLRDEFARHLPQLADIPWFPALGDGACSSVGCGASRPDRIAVMLGTSGALRAMAKPGELPDPPKGLWRYRLDSDRALIGGAISNGGSVRAWLARTLADGHGLDDDAAEIAPASHGLTILPFFSGERAPLWRDDLSAGIFGLSDATTAADIYRAHLEAVAFRMATIREPLKKVTGAADCIATGAALRVSPLWCRIVADVLQEPLLLADEDEASARGAALWTRERLGHGSVADAPLPQIIARHEPDFEAGQRYAEARKLHDDLFAKLFG